MTNTKVLIIGFIFGGIGSFVTAIPVIFLKAYISDLTNIDFFYGFVLGELRYLCICFLPLGAPLFGTLAGNWTYQRCTHMQTFAQVGYVALAGFVGGFVYNIMPFGLYYPSMVP